ncbi:MAG: AraC family ligand binding domain-containing protein, partial [Bacteroidota bacterium]
METIHPLQAQVDTFAQKGKSFDIVPFSKVNFTARNKQSHRIQQYVLLVITEGEGAQLLDFELVSMRPGMVFLMYPGLIHAWEGSIGLS